MAIIYDKATLKSSIKSILDSAVTKVDNPGQTRDDIATAISDAVDTYVKKVIQTATVAHAAGTVIGTAPSGGGPITAGAATDGTIS